MIFLLIGGVMIYQESTSKTNFLKSFVYWVAGVGGNLQEVTTNAVTEYDWLPNSSDNVTGDSDG